MVTPPHYRKWRRWRTFLDNDGEWQRFAGVGAVQAVTDTGRPVVLSFEVLPSDACGVFPVSSLKRLAVASEEEMEDLIPRLSKGDFFRCPGEVTVKEGLTVDRCGSADA